MNDRVELEPAVFLDRLERTATRTETPCGDGTMVWRSWGEGPVLVLFHGGAGSWRHWAHNIDVLSAAVSPAGARSAGAGRIRVPAGRRRCDGRGADRGARDRHRAGRGYALRRCRILVRRHDGDVRRSDPWRARALGDDRRLERRGAVGQRGGTAEGAASRRRGARRDAPHQPEPADDRRSGEDRRSGAGDPGVEHAAFAAEDADLVAQRGAAAGVGAGGRAGERHLGRA